MLNRSASLAMSTSVLEALPGKLDTRKHSPNILYESAYKNNLFGHKYVVCGRGCTGCSSLLLFAFL